MDWTANALDLHNRAEEYAALLRSMLKMTNDDMDFINFHLDLAFEGREREDVRTRTRTFRGL